MLLLVLVLIDVVLSGTVLLFVAVVELVCTRCGRSLSWWRLVMALVYVLGDLTLLRSAEGPYLCGRCHPAMFVARDDQEVNHGSDS